MYIKVGLTLSNNQKEKIKRAFQNNSGLTLKFDVTQLHGSDYLGLTKTQVKQINNAKAKDSSVTLKLSKAQISKQGGFIGTLLAGLAGSLLPSLLGGKGLVLPGTKRGKGLVLPGTNKGKGLVLPGSNKRTPFYFEQPVLGKGLILGKNSPFKNIPILGLIL